MVRRGVLAAKVAVVTGAGRGIGKGITLALAKEGASVACLGRTMETLESTVRDIEGAGGKAVAIRCDVTSQEEVKAAISAAAAAFGTVDILVNNAMELRHQPLGQITEEAMDLAIRTSLYGSLFCMQACFPYLKAHGGKVINFGSGGGTEGWPGQAAYAAAKEGVRGLTKSAAAEWGPLGINVNMVVPMATTDAYNSWFGSISASQQQAFLETVPMRRAGDPELDIGRVVVFLAGPDSDFITGRTIFVDGGRGYYDR